MPTPCLSFCRVIRALSRGTCEVIALDQCGTFKNAAQGPVWRFICSFDAIPKDRDLMVTVLDYDVHKFSLSLP
jgi:hypothetical protein